MEPIELLRRLLDERGVEHYDMQYSYATEVWWGGESFGGGGAKFTAYEQTDGLICLEMADLTPEQAIVATLGSVSEKDSEKDSDGSGECRAEETDTWECVCDQIGRYGKRVTIHVMECSACGQTFEHVNGAYEYCPHCRRRLVIE